MRSSYRAWKDQLLLEYVKFAKRDGERHAVKSTAEREGDESAEVCLWRGSQETELVGGREAGCEQ